ncbi:saccharopine dehydrogenase family protein [Rubrivirga sp.]|uniref:saccharopine dehydrogenase family protein n=1 Tax=Rubrivirga sp. TaxID=1885344 RepID=UPI003B52D81E
MPFLLYGATGYTGRLIADLAVSRGHRPTLAGRDADKLAVVAERTELDAVTVSLDDTATLDRVLTSHPLVLHAAGPFSRTSAPMIEACLRTGTHYLDVTGEIEVFEALAGRDSAARRAGITVLPGTGFDVVPTDCLAMHLKERLPTATTLKLAIRALSSASHGTAQTAVENLGAGGAMRRDGQIVTVPAAHDTVEATFSDGKARRCVAIPWGDVSTAFHSTGIPTITTYAAFPDTAVRVMKASRALGPVLQAAPVQAALRRLVSWRVSGPTEAERERGASFVWGQATDDAGGRAVATWAGPEGYAFTADAALRSALAVLDGRADIGFQTPSTAFGADFALEMDGTSRKDVA